MAWNGFWQWRRQDSVSVQGSQEFPAVRTPVREVAISFRSCPLLIRPELSPAPGCLPSIPQPTSRGGWVPVALLGFSSPPHLPRQTPAHRAIPESYSPLP